MRFALLVLVAASMCEAQSLTYSLSAAQGTRPSARVDGAIAYDSAGRQIILFGGQDDTGVRNDLWVYSVADSRWAQLQPTGAIPPARFGHTLVFDSARRRAILFGGQAGTFYSDVWAFDIATSAWSQLSVNDAGPSRRYGHSAIYETARDRVVISHGFTTAGRFDDTWGFDLKTNTWRDVSPSGTRPLKRCLHHAAYDPDGGRMFLYGGCSSGFGPCPQGDLWSYDLSSGAWTEQTAQPAPPAREHYGMAWDQARGKLVIFGGNGNGLLNDTWEFSPAAKSWQSSSISGAMPADRQRQETTYAGDSGTIWFFGGNTAAGNVNELWSLAPLTTARPSVLPAGIVNAFSGQGAPVAPGEIVAIYGTRLGPSAGLTLGFDPVTGLLPTVAGAVSVSVGALNAALYYVSETQINAQIPAQAPTGETAMIVRYAGQASDSVMLNVSAARPGLFPRVWNEDLLVNASTNPAAAGSIVVLYATGQGTDTAGKLSLEIGGIAAELLYAAAAPGTVGVIQINARVPAGVSGTVPVALKVGANSSQAGVTVAVR